ncbi:hypothetical protein [Tsukamurella sp. NPDC003166]|uniref:hypothetical protein n=1 Tax=Tsukamurella sp. NPDC003166 TaxID=3154444 RepID=UPI0033BC79EB
MNAGVPPHGPYGGPGGPGGPAPQQGGQQPLPPQQQGFPPQRQGFPSLPDHLHQPGRPQHPGNPQQAAPSGYPPVSRPPYGGPQQPPAAYAQQGVPGLVITTKYFPLSWMFAFCKPVIAVDGHESRGVWGPNPIPVGPGRHHVHVHVPYVFPSRTGPADLVVDVVPGRPTELQYKAPVWTFSAGSLGEGEQKYNGVGILVAVMAVPIALLVLMLLLMIVVAAA